MPLKTTPWDSADYLRTEEERARYLAAALEEAPGDAAFITNALGVQLTVSAKPTRKPGARKQAKPVAKRKGTATARRQV